MVIIDTDMLRREDLPWIHAGSGTGLMMSRGRGGLQERAARGDGGPRGLSLRFFAAEGNVRRTGGKIAP